ncbi:MAG: hypothetical protein HKM24_02500 [Gammaproteobacteria bacterium]|nr:hypothetical protein [Gammaproteobacteria bacterium]
MVFKATAHNFRQLRPPVKAMVYLHWIYGFVKVLVDVFVHVFYYQQFKSVAFNIFSQGFYFFGGIVGFCFVGAMIALCRLNIKWGYAGAFTFYFFSYGFLLGEVSQIDALAYMFVNGFAMGLYWLTLHAFELTETHDEERDFYSSMLTAGRQVISLAGPAIATVLFFISDDFLNIGSYTLLFVLAPLIYLGGIPFFKYIGDYYPKPILASDVRHFLFDRHNVYAQLYYFANSTIYAAGSFVIPVAATVFLVNEKYIGIFNTVFAVISVFVLIYLSHHRQGSNRLFYLTVLASAGAAIYFLMAWQFTLWMFVIFSLARILIRPSLQVTNHVIVLKTMETLAKTGSDFYPTMVLRDLALGVWRILTLAALYALVVYTGDSIDSIRAVFATSATGHLLSIVGGALILKTAMKYNHDR